MNYKVVAVLWEDHVKVNRDKLANIEDQIVATLTFGVLVKKTRRYIVLVSEVEKYLDRDDTTYTIILRPTIQAIREYGTIEIENLRIAP